MKILTLSQAQSDPACYDELARALRSGGLVCFPVRGTYRLAADPRSEDAVRKLMQTKRRSGNHPALVLVPDLKAAAPLVEGTQWQHTRRLAERFWPHPLTLVLPPSESLSPAIRKMLTRATGGLGVRVPEDAIAQRIVAAFAAPLLLSSANLANKTGATSSAAVRQRFVGKVDVWIDAGDVKPTAPSTIVSLSEDAWKVVREGDITRPQIEAALA